MNPRLVFLAMAFSSWNLMLSIENSKKKAFTEDSPPAPVISESGHLRLREAVGLVDQNSARATENSQIVEKNIKTLDEELKELDQLEEEHQELKKRYERYLAYAASEQKKNNDAVKELEDWERKAKAKPNSDSSELISKLNTVQQEKTQRKEWDTETRKKIERVHVLERGYLQNMESIANKRRDIVAQINYWKSEQTRHQELIKSLQARRKEIAELGNQSDHSNSEDRSQ